MGHETVLPPLFLHPKVIRGNVHQIPKKVAEMPQCANPNVLHIEPERY